MLQADTRSLLDRPAVKMTDAMDTEDLDAVGALVKTSQEEAASSHTDDDVQLEHTWYGGLKLISTLELDGAASDDEAPDVEYAPTGKSRVAH